jgi:hypothetical protein
LTKIEGGNTQPCAVYLTITTHANFITRGCLAVCLFSHFQGAPSCAVAGVISFYKQEITILFLSPYYLMTDSASEWSSTLAYVMTCYYRITWTRIITAAQMASG